MVQFRRQRWTVGIKARDYWKLDPSITLIGGQLMQSIDIKKKIQHPKKANEARLVKIHERWQRGLVIYDNCNLTELRKFCTDRRLQLSKSARGRRKLLIANLEKADDRGIFCFLEDLPAELRVNIYEVYLGDLELPVNPGPPPITQVSRLLRRECSPIFYEMTKFELELGSKNRLPRLRLISTMPRAVMGQIRKLHVAGFVTGGISEYQCEVILGKGEPELRITQPRQYPNQATEGDLRAAMGERIRELDIQDDEGKLQLQGKDQRPLQALFHEIHIDGVDSI